MRQIIKATRLVCQSALLTVALSSLAQADIQSEIMHGRDIATRLCAGCHGMDGRPGSIIQGISVPSFQAIASRPNRSPERLRAFLEIPQRPMHAFPLQGTEIRDVVSYILSLH